MSTVAKLRSLLAVGAVAVILLAIAPARAIVGGDLDGAAHPNVGAMLLDFGDGPFAGCTGTLIAPRIFLTAAHCVGFVQFLGGTITGVSFDSVVDVNTPLVLDGPPIVDPGWAGLKQVNGKQGYGLVQKSDLHDLAVLILRNDVPLTPVTLPREGLLDEMAAHGGLRGQAFTAVGYGVTSNPFAQVPDPPIRRVASSPFQSLDRARLFVSLRDGGGACIFDSGGPLFLSVDGQDVQVSLNSLAPFDTNCKSFDGNYRLDTPEARTFLRQFVALP